MVRVIYDLDMFADMEVVQVFFQLFTKCYYFVFISRCHRKFYKRREVNSLKMFVMCTNITGIICFVTFLSIPGDRSFKVYRLSE
jgi:hypothetical protein